MAYAQDSKLIQENKHLKEENKMLRGEIKKLQNPVAPTAQNTQMMEALKRGQKHQEEQNKALEELDMED